MSAVSTPFAGFLPTMPMHSPGSVLRSLLRTPPFDALPVPIQDGFDPGALAVPVLGEPEGPAPSAMPGAPSELWVTHRTSGTRIIPLTGVRCRPARCCC